MPTSTCSVSKNFLPLISSNLVPGSQQAVAGHGVMHLGLFLIAQFIRVILHSILITLTYKVVAWFDDSAVLRNFPSQIYVKNLCSSVIYLLCVLNRVFVYCEIVINMFLLFTSAQYYCSE